MMMKTTTVVVVGMEETVVVVMSTHNTVQIVNVLNPFQLTAVNQKVIIHIQ